MTTWTLEDLKVLAAYFVLRGIKKIRLTGGEPLLRRDLPDIIGSFDANS